MSCSGAHTVSGVRRGPPLGPNLLFLALISLCKEKPRLDIGNLNNFTFHFLALCKFQRKTTPFSFKSCRFQTFKPDVCSHFVNTKIFRPKIQFFPRRILRYFPKNRTEIEGKCARILYTFPISRGIIICASKIFPPISKSMHRKSCHIFRCSIFRILAETNFRVKVVISLERW